MYRSLVTIQEAGSGRASPERVARIVLIAGLAPEIPLTVLIIWLLGFTVHPHQAARACIIAGIFLIIASGAQLLVYRIRIKQARKLSAEATGPFG
jgi:uncharacterized protein YhhL (DUF1145 family)